MCCCSHPKEKRSPDKKTRDKRKDKIKTSDKEDSQKTGSPKIDFQADNEEYVDEKALISEEQLKVEALKAYKGGLSSYASLKGQPVKRQQLGEELKHVKRFAAKYGYDVLDNCGSGNYAEVFKVFSAKKKRMYAIKVINCSKMGDNYKKNFLPNEMQILKRMPKHRNIVKVMAVKEHWKRIWVVMEFAAKGTLTDYIRDNGSLTETAAHPFLAQIVNGIHELHSRHIAHRDLKLENILLSNKYVPKISDFSYAIEVDPRRPLSTQYCGSLPYLAPEIIQRLPYNPLISDIWSLGVCFYILLNDGLPFKLDDEDSVMLQKQLNKDWGFRRKVEQNLSRDIKQIVSSMLNPKTELRPKAQDLKSNKWFELRV